jgi:hypothetical protein
MYTFCDDWLGRITGSPLFLDVGAALDREWLAFSSAHRTGDDVDDLGCCPLRPSGAYGSRSRWLAVAADSI